ncbi:MAG: hypothetical protein GY870_07495 [archaeon]|nr:hypothetical protein [archaeon]
MKNLKLKFSTIIILLSVFGCIQPASGAVSSICEGTVVRWNSVTENVHLGDSTASVTYSISEIADDDTTVKGDYYYDSNGDETPDISTINTNLNELTIPTDELCSDSDVSDSTLQTILFISTAGEFLVLKDAFIAKAGSSSLWTYELIGSREIKISYRSTTDNYQYDAYTLQVKYDTNYLLETVEEVFTVKEGGVPDPKIFTWTWDRATISYGDACKAYDAGGSGDSSGDSSGASSGGSSIGPEIFQNPAILAYMGAIIIGIVVFKKRKEQNI